MSTLRSEGLRLMASAAAMILADQSPPNHGQGSKRRATVPCIAGVIPVQYEAARRVRSSSQSLAGVLHRTRRRSEYPRVSTASTFGYARLRMAPTSATGSMARGRSTSSGSPTGPETSTWSGRIRSWAAVARALSRLARLITHDHRGVGLSSRNVDLPHAGDAGV